MRKLYNEFFYIPKYGKIREKVMLARVAMTVVIMVVCLAAMSITAYAYFSHNITSASNTIQAATFKTNVSVQIKDGNGEGVEVITSNYKSHTAELKANTEYFITLRHTDLSTAKTGFVIITADNCESRYHTQQLGKDGNGNTESITFWLKPNADTKVTFLSHWGTSSFYSDFKDVGVNSEMYILDGETVALSIVGAISENPPADGTEGQEGTTPSETTTTPPTESTTPPATITTAPPETTVSTNPPATNESSEPADTTEPSQFTEPSESSETTEPISTEEATSATTTEASE